MFPLFPLGQIVATPGALAALERAKQTHPLPGPSCNRGLGRTGTNRCRRERVQRGSWVSIAEQLPDRCWGEAVDNHRSRPVGNHATFARRVLTSCMKGSSVDEGFLWAVVRRTYAKVRRADCNCGGPHYPAPQSH